MAEKRKVLQNDLANKAYNSVDLRDISLTTIQLCVLLGTLCYVDGRSEAEAVYYGTATRLAAIIDLPKRNCATELERQINSRGMFSLILGLVG